MDPITLALIMGGTSTLLGGLGAKQKQKQEQAGMMANAEAMKYSPWTHMNTSMQTGQTEDPALAGLKAGLGGAMAGANFAQQFGGQKQIKASDQQNAPPLNFKY